MKKIWKKCSIWFLLCAVIFGFAISPVEVRAANGVSSRIAEVKKKYPNGKQINEIIYATTQVSKNGHKKAETSWHGGCNALVAYTTLKVFHNPYVPGSLNYSRVGRTASTGSPNNMKKTFSKAKKGDVIRWHSGNKEYHFAIFLSSNSNGVYVYEANFGSKNKIWYNHFWNWGNMSNWSGGATQVSVYRSKNYNQVNAKKAAKNLKKGAKFTVNQITYKVVSNSISGGKVKVVKKAKGVKVPKAVGLNYDTAKYLKKYKYNIEAVMLEMKEYWTAPKYVADEQFFKVTR